MFWSLAAFLEPVAHHVQKLIDRHSDRFCFVGVKASESLCP
jgi:hypothetical protein